MSNADVIIAALRAGHDDLAALVCDLGDDDLGFLRVNQVLSELYESMDAGVREGLRIDIAFMPAPVDVATAARLRLNELALHSWDVRVGFDERATLAPEATGPLLQGTGDLLGFISAPHLDRDHAVIGVTTSDPASTFALRLADPVVVDPDPADAEQHDGTVTLPAEAWLRLVAGRLPPRHTPMEAATTGYADLGLLRQIFPGY